VFLVAEIAELTETQIVGTLVLAIGALVVSLGGLIAAAMSYARFKTEQERANKDLTDLEDRHDKELRELKEDLEQEFQDLHTAQRKMERWALRVTATLERPESTPYHQDGAVTGRVPELSSFAPTPRNQRPKKLFR